jgi:hypothetical protein
MPSDRLRKDVRRVKIFEDSQQGNLTTKDRKITIHRWRLSREVVAGWGLMR